MLELGYYSLIFAWPVTLFALLALVLAPRRSEALRLSAYRAAESSFLLVTASSVALLYLLIFRDFRLEYVASYVSKDLSAVYAASAFWGGQAGSLLLWTLFLGFFGIIVIRQNQSRRPDVLPYVTATIQGVQLFFLTLMLYSANPFARVAEVPADGQGLNPLLQNFFMILHPPFLYLGYVGFTIPFAFALAALLLRKTDPEWIRATRRWTLVSWFFLTAGILLGSYWAYLELGWGGYWAWDPVENASLLPWLTATAFLHSVMIEERKGMLKRWNLVLVILTFELCIFGTFLTRSGIVSSVHAFAGSNMGPLFLVFLGTSSIFAFGLLIVRSRETQTEQRILSLLSRESSFLLNNLIFVGITFAVFWGTLFPVISEAVTGQKVSVSAPFFNTVATPLAIALLVLSGICPLIAWRKATFRNFRRNLLTPFLLALLTGFLLRIAGVHGWAPLTFFSSASFVIYTVLLEFMHGARARSSIAKESCVPALVHLIMGNKRRYGGFFIHLGIAIAFIGIAGSSYFSHEFDFHLKAGQSAAVGGYRVEMVELQGREDMGKNAVYARVRLLKNGKLIRELQPEKHFHAKSEQPQTEVSLASAFNEDFYLVLESWEQDGTAFFKAWVNPLVALFWLGGGMALLGTLFVLFPDARRRSAVRSSVSDERASRVQARRKARRVALWFVLIFLPVNLQAQTPVRDVTSQLVCQCGCGNMIVANCDCSNAAKIKEEVGKLLGEGKTKGDILALYVSRHGQSILAAPQKKGFNLLAWIMPFAAILAGGFWVSRKLRGWTRSQQPLPAPAGTVPAEEREKYRSWIKEELEKNR
ncbi:MAG: cytochrome c biogenesis protein CcsA [Acidobacteria bacterium]|nr:cytochrome c biogenesis protein CcsA [Acidobacteriota bacterium]